MICQKSKGIIFLLKDKLLYNKGENAEEVCSMKKDRIKLGLRVAILIVIIGILIGFSRFSNTEVDTTYAEKLQNVSVYEAYGDEYRLSSNIDKIKLIRDNDVFQTLDLEEKKEVLMAVGYCEARYLGLCEISIVFADMDDTSLGNYNHETKTITINERPLKNAELTGGSARELCETMFHECRHCYQHLLIELYLDSSPAQRNLILFYNEGVNAWLENMEDYKSGGDTAVEMLDYVGQSVELDAITYSKEEADTLYGEIDKLLNEDVE